MPDLREADALSINFDAVTGRVQAQRRTPLSFCGASPYRISLKKQNSPVNLLHLQSQLPCDLHDVAATASVLSTADALDHCEINERSR